MSIAALNHAAANAPEQLLTQKLLPCCGSRRWAEQLLRLLPVSDAAELLRASDAAEKAMTRTDWLEAFAAHPRVRGNGMRWLM